MKNEFILSQSNGCKALLGDNGPLVNARYGNLYAPRLLMLRPTRAVFCEIP